MADAVGLETLDLAADRALFEGKLQGMVVTCYQNERPLAGLAGLLDWRFHGALSRCLRQGAFSGKPGECVYFPVTRHLQGGSTQVIHLILAGCGHSTEPGARGDVPAETLALVRQNLASLRLKRIGASRADFGAAGPEYFGKSLKGVELWITP